MNAALLDKMDAATKAEFGDDPLNSDSKDDTAQKRSLRNQFNFQERSAQTFNMPYREKGIKTNPPVCTTFSLETTQWMIFDSYLQTWEEI